jgi:predicted nucleic acid-binding protein
LEERLANAARRKISKLPPTTFLRAADALHLTCAAEAGYTAIHTSDRHMIAAAPAFGLMAVTL